MSNNQALISNSDILSVMNRMMTYTEYEALDDVDEKGPVLSTVKGVLNAQISFCLLSLVEGQAEEDVVTRLINGIEWENLHRHLKVLKCMLQSGVIPQESEKAADMGGKKKKKKKKKKNAAPDGVSVPSYVSDPKSGLAAEWLRREAFRFYSFLAKVNIGGQAFKVSLDLQLQSLWIVPAAAVS